MSEINVARLVKLDEPLELGKVAKPTPGPTDVLVKVEACCLVPNSYNLVTGKANLSCLASSDWTWPAQSRASGSTSST